MAVPSALVYVGACTLTILVVRLARFWLTQRTARRLQCRTYGPCYPHYDPVLGLDFILENGRKICAYEFAEGVRQRFYRYGTTYYARMGFQDIINTIDTENLQTIMKSKSEDYSIITHREKLVRTLLGDGIFTLNGQQWRQSRWLVHGAMNSLEMDLDLLEQKTKSMTDYILRHSDPGAEVLDFGKLATSYTFDTAASFIFGHYKTGLEQFAADFDLLSSIGRSLTIYIALNKHLGDILFWRQFRPAQARIFSFVSSSIKQARRTIAKNDQNPKTKHASIIESLATKSRDDDMIRGEALNLFLAGHDTVRISFTELFWQLTRCPHAWAKLRLEVASLEGRRPTLAELKNMTYLRWTMDEAARLGPTLSAHGRKAIRDTVLPKGGGQNGSEPLLVQKGTYIAYSNYALHRDPEVFGPDVDIFRPERWAEVKPAKFEFLPFGAGSRFCPGEKMGWTMVAYATVRLAQVIEQIDPPADDKPWQEAGSFAFYNRHGVHMLVTPALKG